MSTVKFTIGPSDHGRRMTLDEFIEAEEDEGFRYELAEGVLEVGDLPKLPHWRVVWAILGLMRDYQRDRPGLIDLVGGGGEVRIWLPAGHTGRHPDVGVAFFGAPADPLGNPRLGLAVEVVSSSSRTRDYVTKRREYLAYGLQEYWFVDPKIGRVTVLVRRGEDADAIWEERVASGDDTIPSEVLPGLAVRISTLWADIDRAAL